MHFRRMISASTINVVMCINDALVTANTCTKVFTAARANWNLKFRFFVPFAAIFDKLVVNGGGNLKLADATGSCSYNNILF